MGSLEGVVDTRSAWIGKHEVVEVRFRPDVTPYAKLIDTALEHGCADRVWTTTEAQLALAMSKKKVAGKVERLEGQTRAAKASDQLYYLERSPYRYVPLTPLQARRVNGALYLKQEPKRWLSPRQRELLTKIEAGLDGGAEAFADLTRPTSIDGLENYETALRARLDAAAR